MTFAGYIARRYLRSRRHSRFLSRGSVTAVAGIAIGVAVLNVTMAVMNGFHLEMRRTFVENMPMISVHTGAPEGLTGLGGLMDLIGQDPEVTGMSPFVRQEVLVTSTYRFGRPPPQAGILWGVDPDLVNTVQPLGKYLSPAPEVLAALARGGAPRVILGADLANLVAADIGDTVVLTSAVGELDLDEVETVSEKFVVAGFFDTGMYEFDSRFIYADWRAAAGFLGYVPGSASLLGVRVQDLMRADKVAARLEEKLGRDYRATDWMALNRSLFQWIKMEKVIMFLLLGMIILIAGFNIVGMLTMMVGERRREIGILLAMGVRRRQIMGIFLLNGLWLGAVGVTIGSAIGLAAVWALQTFGLALPGDVYMVETVPAALEWLDFVLIAAVSLAMSLLSGLWPSWEASNLDPMAIIRYS
jgi:lipoprotein-releasing system permease protein